MKIYDCFQFFNELDVLEIRFNMLDQYVDKFILVESHYSHQNKEKELYYDINKDTRFKQFRDKVHHVIIDKFPDTSYWGPVNYQRNRIMDEINLLCSDEDIVAVSDLDELWDPEKLIPVLKNLDDETLFRARQKVSYFYFNFIATECGDWLAPMFARAKLFKRLCNIEGMKFSYGAVGIRSINTTGNYKQQCSEEYSGWQFSYSEDPVTKVQNFNHSECSWMSKEYFDDCIKNYTNPFTKQQSMVKINESEFANYLPKYVYNNLEKYMRHILC